jgi:hypothetical protein
VNVSTAQFVVTPVFYSRATLRTVFQ